MKLTEKQARAVETQTKNVLVSAAAGSGKTSVLAKRVARLVLDGGDIRNMLVMTFTNAAAAEMRQRIAREIRSEAMQMEDKRLYEQAEFVAAADISTFHSFCGKVVRKNYALLGLSPGVRIMDEGEMNRMKSTAVRELFDALYEEQDEGFLRLLRRYTKRGNDRRLAEYLFRIYDYIMSKPDPFGWAEWSERKNNAEYIAWLEQQYNESVAECLLRSQRWIQASAQISEGKEEAQYTQDMECIALLEELREDACERGAQHMREAYRGAKIPNITKGMDESRKARIQKLYAEARKKLKEAFASEEEPFDEQVGRELAHTQQDVGAMLTLVRKFHKAYASDKSEANVLDYSDMEHFALQAFQEAEVRAMYAELYEYIFVDEYQDTNPVQEEIIRAVSAEGSLFMVGDIKQSIYKFRLADPFIFREKAREFRGEAQTGELILMNDNFRSRSGVIDAVNSVMERVMCENLGEVHYDEGERLCGSAQGGSAEILLCLEQPDEEQSKHVKQAEMIASNIERELQGTVADKQTGEQRKVQYGDVAVLFRSRSAMMYLLKTQLDRKGIPCAIDVEQSRDLKEIELFVNVLKLIDNPKQDVPLLSVMRSYIGGMDEQDFAQIKVADERENVPFHRSIEKYAKNGEDKLAKKMRALFARLNFLRVCAVSLSLSELIGRVAQEFDFETYLACAPGGEMKQTVFAQFIAKISELAASQENSLYLLLRALYEIKKRDGAYLKAAVKPGSADCVHITTIHSAKGLEYPIVYVANLERTLSVQDFKNRMLIHAEYGLMAQYIDDEKFLRCTTMEIELAKRQIRQEYLSEELRVLYVAMTRAREKLVLTGSVGNWERAKEDWRLVHDMQTYEDAKSMLGWIMAANEDDLIPVRIYEESNETKEQEKPDLEKYRERLRKLEDTAELLSAEVQTAVPAKVSVSAVKQAEKNARRFLTPVLEESDEITGARLGTIVHSVMEQVVSSERRLEDVLEWMQERLLLTEQEKDVVRKHADWIEQFLQTPLYTRLKKAQRVLKEQPFNLEVKANSIGYEGNGTMMVQGILDLAFLEDEWVLVDYKTDRVTENTVEEVANGYAVQVELYTRALEEITGISVKEKYLYFLRLQKCIQL